MKALIVLAGFFFAFLSTNLSFAEPGTEPKKDEQVAKNLVIEENDIYVPEVRLREERHKQLAQFDKDFTFDWHEPNLTTDDEKKIEVIEAFFQKIEKPTDPVELDEADQELMGTLSYRIGTYYLYVYHHGEPAISHLEIAESLHKQQEAKAWDNNQLAYAYREKYHVTREKADREKALYYASKVIALYPNTKNKTVAFAYTTKGLIHDSADDFKMAEAHLKTALSIYETLPNGKDEQYAHTKIHLAGLLLKLDDGRDVEAINMLQEAKEDLMLNNSSDLFSLGKPYLETSYPKQAKIVLSQTLAQKSNFFAINYK